MHIYGDIPIAELLNKSSLLLKLIIFFVVAIGPLGFSFNIFRKLITKEYLYQEINIEDHLKNYFHGRFSTLKSSRNPISKESLEKFQNNLSRQVLIFVEKILCEEIGKHHYELSVFFDKDNPEIICYFDSNKNEIPRSSNERKRDPDYYKKRRYQVVELLLSPVTKPFIIRQTDVAGVNYSFVDEHQKKYIKSSLLYCFDIETPRALVITCDKPDAFRESDLKIITLITAAGLAMRGEYELSNLISTT